MQRVQRKKFLPRMIRQRELILMSIPVAVYVFIFHYLPLRGWRTAFYEWYPRHQNWAEPIYRHFQFLFTEAGFGRIMTNTLAMSFINLILGFTTSIFLALMINEVRKMMFKRVVQTISYLPHFLSWVIACSLIADFLAGDGIVNTLLLRSGLINQPNIFLANPDQFWWIVGWSNVWKSVGWNTIIYLAAISSISPELYESAELDGAGRFQRIWHITLPGIKSTILVLVIMNIGWILNAGFEIQWLLSNDLTIHTAETIDVFVINYAFRMRNFSLATATGMFRTVVGIVLIFGANFISKRVAKESLI